jgi:uncharacterized protein YxeA
MLRRAHLMGRSSLQIQPLTVNQAKHLMKALLSILFVISLSLVSVRADDAAVEKKLSKIPKAAVEALKKAAGSAHIESVNIEKDGRTTVYEVEFKETGKPDREVSVKADGTLNAEEFTIPLAEVPAKAKAAIEAGAKGAEIKRVQHINRAGKITYEALYVLKGKETEVEYLEDGSLKPE